jgi:hypothetical protein
MAIIPIPSNGSSGSSPETGRGFDQAQSYVMHERSDAVVRGVDRLTFTIAKALGVPVESLVQPLQEAVPTTVFVGEDLEAIRKAAREAYEKTNAALPPEEHYKLPHHLKSDDSTLPNEGTTANPPMPITRASAQPLHGEVVNDATAEEVERLRAVMSGVSPTMESHEEVMAWAEMRANEAREAAERALSGEQI